MSSQCHVDEIMDVHGVKAPWQREVSSISTYVGDDFSRSVSVDTIDMQCLDGYELQLQSSSENDESMSNAHPHMLETAALYLTPSLSNHEHCQQKWKEEEMSYDAVKKTEETDDNLLGLYSNSIETAVVVDNPSQNFGDNVEELAQQKTPQKRHRVSLAKMMVAMNPLLALDEISILEAVHAVALHFDSALDSKQIKEPCTRRRLGRYIPRKGD